MVEIELKERPIVPNEGVQTSLRIRLLGGLGVGLLSGLSLGEFSMIQHYTLGSLIFLKAFKIQRVVLTTNTLFSKIIENSY